jgi:hypothetical protein
MKLKRCQDSYYNTVIVDTDTDQVIGNANLIIEWKFIHECSKVINCPSRRITWD